MITYTPKQVQKRVKDFVAKHGTARDAAADIGCTEAQLSSAVNGNPPCASILAAIGLQRTKVYAAKTS